MQGNVVPAFVLLTDVSHPKPKAGRGERIRTSGLIVPNDARYQAALHPDDHSSIHDGSQDINHLVPARKSEMREIV